MGAVWLFGKNPNVNRFFLGMASLNSNIITALALGAAQTTVQRICKTAFFSVVQFLWIQCDVLPHFYVINIFNRPGVDVAVLQTPLSLIHLLIE